MPERSYPKQLIVLIAAFVVAMTIVVIHYPRTVSDDKSIGTKVSLITSQKTERPRQTITVNGYNCRIEDFNYEDDRNETTGDLSDIKIVEATRKVCVSRRYLGDTSIAFRLIGMPYHKDSAFNVIEAKGPISYVYSYDVKFGKEGFADITVLMRKGSITTIYQWSPKPKTFYQTTETGPGAVRAKNESTMDHHR